MADFRFISYHDLVPEVEGSTSLAVVPRVGGGALVAPAPLEPRAATIGNVSLLLPLQVLLEPSLKIYTIFYKFVRDVWSRRPDEQSSLNRQNKPHFGIFIFQVEIGFYWYR